MPAYRTPGEPLYAGWSIVSFDLFGWLLASGWGGICRRIEGNVPGYEHREADHTEDRSADVAEASLVRSIGNILGSLVDVDFVDILSDLYSQPIVIVKMAAAA